MTAALTPDQVEFIFCQARLGHSAAEISRELKVRFGVNLSRAAVTGRIWRANNDGANIARGGFASWSGSGKTPRIKVALEADVGVLVEADAPAATATSAPALPCRRVDHAVYATGGGVAILDVQQGQCRWPVGGGDDASMMMCGVPVREGSSYCDHHHAIAMPARLQPKRFFNLERLSHHD